MESIDRRTMLLLAWAWHVPATFDACPLRSALWCFALESADLHPDDLDFALRKLDEASAFNEPTRLAS